MYEFEFSISQIIFHLPQTGVLTFALLTGFIIEIPWYEFVKDDSEADDDIKRGGTCDCRNGAESNSHESTEIANEQLNLTWIIHRSKHYDELA